LLVKALFRPLGGLAFAATLLASCCAALAASGPPAEYQLSTTPELAYTSPDGATKLEQYMKDSKNFLTSNGKSGRGTANR
jgi:hypothetical protein